MIPFNMGLNTDKAVEQETVTEAFEGYVECPLFAQECRMPEEELKEPEHLKKRMLIKRTPTLEMLRKQFVGRAIHTSWEHWKKDIENCCRNTVNTFPGNKQVTEKHCATCGTELSADAKFCGQCGTRAI